MVHQRAKMMDTTEAKNALSTDFASLDTLLLGKVLEHVRIEVRVFNCISGRATL